MKRILISLIILLELAVNVNGDELIKRCLAEYDLTFKTVQMDSSKPRSKKSDSLKVFDKLWDNWELLPSEADVSKKKLLSARTSFSRLNQCGAELLDIEPNDLNLDCEIYAISLEKSQEEFCKAIKSLHELCGQYLTEAPGSSAQRSIGCSGDYTKRSAYSYKYAKKSFCQHS